MFLIYINIIIISIDIIINNFTYHNGLSEYTLCMSDNTTDNIPRFSDNPDYPRLIRYITTNFAALMLRRPISRGIGLAIANTTNIMLDIFSNEERTNYWIDQYNFYQQNGRLRGGQPGTGPFERGTNTEFT